MNLRRFQALNGFEKFLLDHNYKETCWQIFSCSPGLCVYSGVTEEDHLTI